VRELLDRRPLLVLFTGMVVGYSLWHSAVNLIFLIIFLIWIARPWIRVIFGVGVLLGLFGASRLPRSLVEQNELIREVATVSSSPRQRFGETFATVVIQSHEFRAHFQTRPLDLHIGDRGQVSGVLKPLSGQALLLSRIHPEVGRIEVTSWVPCERAPFFVIAGSLWRESFRNFIGKWSPPVVAQLTEAVCFDLSGGLEDQTLSSIRGMGALHILTASGLHVIAIFEAMLWALAWLPIPRTLQLSVAFGLLFLYCEATGFSSAVVRASIMLAISSFAYLARRVPDSLSSLAFACIIYLLWKPQEIYGLGFQLSTITVGAFSLFAGRASSTASKSLWSYGKKWVYQTGQGTGIAFLATAPLIAYYQGNVNALAIPANVLLGLPAVVAIVSGLAAHLVGLAIPILGIGILTLFTQPMVGWILWFSEEMSPVSGGVTVPGFSSYWLVIIYFAMLMTWRRRIVQP
jgi:ComEC/Rec2-related protein